MKAFGFSLCVASFTVCFSVILPVCAARQAPAQQPAATGSLNGTWINVDPATRGIVRIQIKGNKVHPYGACHPDLCDWGVLKAKAFAGGADSSSAAALLAKQTTAFGRVQITLSLDTRGRLQVEEFTHFTDSSGRVDYRTVNTFMRNPAAYVP